MFDLSKLLTLAGSIGAIIAGGAGSLAFYRDRERVRLRADIVIPYRDSYGQTMNLSLPEAARTGKLDAGSVSIHVTAVSLGRPVHLEKWMVSSSTGNEEWPSRGTAALERGETASLSSVPLEILRSVHLTSTTGRVWTLGTWRVRRLRRQAKKILTKPLPPRIRTLA